MLDLGTLRLGIKVDSAEAQSELNKVGETIEEDGVKAESLASKAKTMIKAFAAAYAVKELVKLGKAALDAYAAYEQLEGGVNKIFGDKATEQVMKNAERAYQTAGISANKYMEQVTSFSASLIQSLDGDTVKAAQVADMAIQDMSDNANTFGTSIESIQTAYQGFAKQNYTMLDNLKLGYGGTKTEMERLLADAEAFSGVHYDIENLNDVYEAIHVVQQEMNITGTTAKEAASTIEGSMNMMKASWQNLLISIGSGEGLDTAVNNFLASLGTVAQNIIPRVITIAGAVVQGVVQAIPQIMESLAQAISDFADTMASDASGEWIAAGGKLILDLVTGLLRAAPKLLAAVGKLALQLLKTFSKIDLRSAGKAILDSLFAGLKAAWGALSSWVSSKAAWIKKVFGGAKAAGNAPGGPVQRIGLREVPYDGYQTTLHKGETVLTAAETNRYKELLNAAGPQTINDGGVTVNVYGTDNMNVKDLANEVKNVIIREVNNRRLAWQ